MSTTEINIIMKQERERPLLSSPSEGILSVHVFAFIFISFVHVWYIQLDQQQLMCQFNIK